MPTVDSSALSGASENATGDRVESPDACAECIRLDQQENAAILLGDESRATDVRVMRRKHRAQAHHENSPTLLPSDPPAGFNRLAGASGSAFSWHGRMH